MKRIYLVRHCKATGQEPNAQLTEEGYLQAVKLVDFFRDRSVSFIISSPFERAISTARPLANHLNLEIRIDDRLSERVLSSEDLDDWMDRLRESFINLDLKLPGGESSREAMLRAITVIEELLNQPDEEILLVTHGNLMSLILMYFNNSFGFNEWKLLTNPDVYELSVPKGNKEIIVNRIWK